MEYAYTHKETLQTTGYFRCVPVETTSLTELLDQLEKTPFDLFLHRFLLEELCNQPLEKIQELLGLGGDARAQLLLELTKIHPSFKDLANLLSDERKTERILNTPLAALFLEPKTPLEGALKELSSLWEANRTRLTPLPAEIPLPLCKKEAPLAQEGCIDELYRQKKAAKENLPNAAVLYRTAMDLLLEAGIDIGKEERHEATLSPIALLRSWPLSIHVTTPSLTYTLKGTATSYGRGLSLEAARISCIMEVIERISSYVSVGKEKDRYVLMDQVYPNNLSFGSIRALTDQGRACIDLLAYHCPKEVLDFPLSFLEAKDAQGATVLVPAQLITLFANYGDVELPISLGSTGLGCGATLPQAKPQALTEILERDAELTTPFDESQCFCLQSRDKNIQALLNDYAAQNIHVQFRLLPTPFGVPVVQAFVLGADGSVHSACACKLNARQALLSALTETPWPYRYKNPTPKPSAPSPKNLPTRFLEDLPNYDLGSPTANLALLEELLTRFGIPPLYVELTRKDLTLPVVRALLPGLGATLELGGTLLPNPRFFKTKPIA